MHDGRIEELCEAIFMQAVNDYRELRRAGTPIIKTKDEGTYSIGELEMFFRGKWAKNLAKIMKLRVSNDAILKQLQTEPM